MIRYLCRARRWALANLLVLLAGATPAFGVGEALSGPAQVDLTADELTYDRPQSTYRALGNVHLEKGGLTLLADEVRFNTETEEATAIGNVRLSDPEAVVEAGRMDIHLDTGRGQLREGRILLRERNYRIAGDLIERLGERDYFIENGTFTTCEAPRPDWKFGARRLDVTVGGYARARHVLFYLRDLPVFYFPYFFYPVKTERESGFLIPRVGVSNRRGTQISTAWYQVIGRNQDATFSLDYLSKLGLGKGVEYRYIFGTEDEGEAKAYHINGFNDAESRYALDWVHSGHLPGDVRMTADVQWVSSRDYFRDFGEVAEEYNRDEAESIFALSRHWAKRYSLTGQLKYTKNLVAENDGTLQKLPEVVFAAVRRPLGQGPFLFAMDASTTHFWREEGSTGQRMSLRPELSAAFHPGDLLGIFSRLGYRERLYWISGDDSFDREGIPDFSTRMSSRFSRVFAVEGRRIKKIQHTLEPELAYSYVPDVDQSSLPRFDVLDRVEPENRISYALINRLTARLESDTGESVYHEFLYLRLSQSYDIRESRRDLLLPGERRAPFSDLRTELIVRPNRWSYLDLETRFDVENGGDLGNRFFLLNLRGGLHDRGGNGVGLEYRFHRDQLDYLTAAVDVALLRPVYLNYQHRHDFDDGRTLEKVVNLEYRADCWSIFLTLRDRLEDTEYLVSFALTGLGKMAELGGRLGGSGRSEE